MAGVRNVVVFFYATLSLTVLSHPHPAPQGDSQQEEPSFGNLKHTFGSKDEIPAAFFDTKPLRNATGSSSNVAPVPTASTGTERQVYPPCQDGSGGMCVNDGTCPSNLKPAKKEPGACASGQECCFGAPSNDRTCGSRGGECMPANQCGSAPRFQDAEDCDKKNGQICCILI